MHARLALLVAAALVAGLANAVSRETRATKRQGAGLGGNVTFSRYMRYDEMVGYLRSLARKRPNLIKVGSIGKTVEGRDTVYAHISTKAGNPVMLVDALMHARERITGPSALYLIQQVVEGGSRQLLSGLDIVVVPVLNPDGYEYSITKDSAWRKNRNPAYNASCVGVDLNRNFNSHWADFRSPGGASGGASDDPCNLTYAGPRAESEPETRNYKNFIINLKKKKRINMYVNIHSLEQAIYYPWGYSRTAPKIPDISKLRKIAKEANKVMVKAGAKSKVIEGMAANSDPATGTVTDWVREQGVNQSFCLELPAGGSNGFNIDRKQIVPITKQTFEGLKVFAKYAKTPL